MSASSALSWAASSMPWASGRRKSTSATAGRRDFAFSNAVAASGAPWAPIPEPSRMSMMVDLIPSSSSTTSTLAPSGALPPAMDIRSAPLVAGLVDQLEKPAGREGFAQDGEGARLRDRFHVDLGGVGRHHDDFGRGLTDLLKRLQPTHVGHAHIHDHDVEIAFGHLVERGAAVLGLGHLVSGGVEDVAHRLPHAGFVVDHENARSAHAVSPAGAASTGMTTVNVAPAPVSP